ncbi:MAG: hypothetical protein N2316_13350 [Spirochaetes bacterium]|nr:hypothetical protein [Spirochaetota bacterium]
MLREVKVAQKEKNYRRRWFEDDFFELIVWYDSSDVIHGFQLCYAHSGVERALTWKSNTGFVHEKIDDSRVFGHMPATPILVPDGIFPAEVIITEFTKRANQIDETIVQFVQEKLLEYQQLLKFGKVDQ